MTQTFHLNANHREICIEQETPFKRLRLVRAHSNRPVSSHPLAGLSLKLQSQRYSYNMYSWLNPNNAASFDAYDMLQEAKAIPHLLKEHFNRVTISPEQFVPDADTEVEIELEIQ